MTLADDYAVIEEYALQEKRQREIEAWFRELRQSVYVDIKDERFEAPDIAG